MGKTLSMLPQLSRLDLSNNRIKFKLRQLISNTQQPLQHLRLVACGLTEADIRYLSLSHHTTALQHLDISENTMTLCIGSLGRLLHQAYSTLLVVELEDCKLDDDCILQLLPCISTLHSMLYLNIAQNSLTCPVYMDIGRVLSQLHAIQAVKSSYCNECYLVDDEEEFNRQKQTFFNQFQSVLNKERDICLVTVEVDVNYSVVNQ